MKAPMRERMMTERMMTQSNDPYHGLGTGDQHPFPLARNPPRMVPSAEVISDKPTSEDLSAPTGRRPSISRFG